MPRKSPWHSVKEEVHHDNTECNTGNNIEAENLRQGTGNSPSAANAQISTPPVADLADTRGRMLNR